MRPGIDRPGQRQCEMVPFAGFHPVGGRRGRNRLAVSRRKHAARLAVRPADSQMVSVEGVGIGRVDQAELAAPRELPEPADAQPVVAVFGRESGGEQVRILPLRNIGGLKRLLRHAVDEKRRRRGVLLNQRDPARLVGEVAFVEAPPVRRREFRLGELDAPVEIMRDDDFGIY